MRQLQGGADVSVSVRDAAEVNRVRREKGVTQQELAVAVGVSQQFISYLLKGERGCSLAVARRIYDTLGLTDVEADRLFMVAIRRAAIAGTTRRTTTRNRIAAA